MLRTSIHTATLLTFSIFTPACDDPSDPQSYGEFGEDDGDLGDIQPRCTPSPCTDYSGGNTNWVGSNPVDTVTQNAWNVPTQLSNGHYMLFSGVTCPHASIVRFNATPTGELMLWKSVSAIPGPSTVVRGEAVEQCVFHAQFSDTASFVGATLVDLTIEDVAQFTHAGGGDGFKYLMSVNDLNTDLPAVPETDDHYPTCYDNADAPGNYYLHIRPGLALDTNSWQLTADATKQSWVCEAGAFGHFGRKNVNVYHISDPVLGTTEGRAWGLYHHGASHTVPGNPIRIHHPTIPGYDLAPNPCSPVDTWYREALWSAGSLLCRGSNATSWSDEINRNAFSQGKDWDQDTSVASVSVCSGTPNHDFETYAKCYMNGLIKVCPPPSC